MSNEIISAVLFCSAGFPTENLVVPGGKYVLTGADDKGLIWGATTEKN